MRLYFIHALRVAFTMPLNAWATASISSSLKSYYYTVLSCFFNFNDGSFHFGWDWIRTASTYAAFSFYDFFSIFFVSLWCPYLGCCDSHCKNKNLSQQFVWIWVPFIFRPSNIFRIYFYFFLSLCYLFVCSSVYVFNYFFNKPY